MKKKHVTKLIKEVNVTELKQFNDERGSVLGMFRNDDPEFSSFGECYFSEILPTAVKAWKLHEKQTQHFAVPIGRVKLVIYDNRNHSATYRNLQILELGRPDSYLRVMIPPGLWYGFSCISETTALVVNCSDIPHDPQEGKTKVFDDDSIPYKW